MDHGGEAQFDHGVRGLKILFAHATVRGHARLRGSRWSPLTSASLCG